MQRRCCHWFLYPNDNQIVHHWRVVAVAMKRLVTKTRSSMRKKGGQAHNKDGRVDRSLNTTPEQHLRAVLSDPELGPFYKRFMDDKYCGEIVSFWLAVEDFRHLNEAERQDTGSYIIETFLRSGAGSLL